MQEPEKSDIGVLSEPSGHDDWVWGDFELRRERHMLKIIVNGGPVYFDEDTGKEYAIISNKKKVTVRVDRVGAEKLRDALDQYFKSLPEEAFDVSLELVCQHYSIATFYG